MKEMYLIKMASDYKGELIISNMMVVEDLMDAVKFVSYNNLRDLNKKIIWSYEKIQLYEKAMINILTADN